MTAADHREYDSASAHRCAAAWTRIPLNLTSCNRHWPTFDDVGREFLEWHYYAPEINVYVFAGLPAVPRQPSGAERTLLCVSYASSAGAGVFPRLSAKTHAPR